MRGAKMSKKLRAFLIQVNKKQIVGKEKSISAARQLKMQLVACLNDIDPNESPTEGPMLGVMIRSAADSIKRAESEVTKLRGQIAKLQKPKGP
jgi:hypothetical protein